MKNSINYLKSNKIKYFKIFNYLISFPTKSIQYEELYTKNTKRIYLNIPSKKLPEAEILILITKY